MRTLLRDTRVQRLLVANTLGSIGSGVTIFAVPWLLVHLPEGNAAYRWATIGTTLVLFLLMPYYGAWVDRHSRKTALLGSEAWGFLATTTMAGVTFARGGYGSNRIAEAALRRLDSAARSKAYLGFSDCGFLLAGLYKAGVGRPAHGPMPINIRSRGGEAAVHRALSWLAGRDEGLEPGLDERPAAAFNLMTLAALTGTALMPDLTGHVVIVEEVAEHLYAIDRLFFHMVHQLKGVAGLRLGMVTAVPENDRPFGAEAEDIARHWCDAAGIPFLGRAEVGHHPDNRIVPFGLAAGHRRA